jgi:hypothetical protein
MVGQLFCESDEEYFERLSAMSDEDMCAELETMQELQRQLFKSFLQARTDKAKERAMEAIERQRKLENGIKRQKREINRLTKKLKAQN